MNTENSDNPVKKSIFRLIENYAAIAVLLVIVLILFIEIILRRFSAGIPAASEYIQHFVLWTAFLGAMITTREGKHLSLGIGIKMVAEPFRSWIKIGTGIVSTAICTVLTVASIRFLRAGFDIGKTVGIFPVHLFLAIMPLGFFIITIRFIRQAGKNLKETLIVASGVLIGLFLSLHIIFYEIQEISLLINPEDYTMYENMEGFIEGFNSFFDPFMSVFIWPASIILIAAGIFGAPIFIVLGGLAVLLFSGAGLPLSDIPHEVYEVLSGYEIPAIPLFTLAGFLLAESKASERLVRLFRTLLGWLPGGLAIVTVIVCAFFTTFTGASGVTILALGALLSIALIKRNYREDFSYGLLSGAGSVGLLFPPSLPVIMYGVAATISIKDLFIGGVVPGALLVITLSCMGIWHAVKKRIERIPFKAKDTLIPLRNSLPEIALPFIVSISFFSGFTTLVGTSAITVLYILLIEVFLYKDIRIRELPNVFLKAIPIIGGIIIIMAVAKGLSYYIIDQEIPQKLVEWCGTYIQSPIVFLLLLNIGLLITGCFLDIYAAIFVVVPLIVPLGVAYNIHPVHLGIIFLANLQLGYLTPPVGLNLFYASYCFGQPLTKIYKQVLPFFVAMLIAVLFITYVPPVTTMFLKPVNNPGDVWLVEVEGGAGGEESADSGNLITDLRMDTGTQKLTSYELEIVYDPEMVEPDGETGNNGVIPGINGFVTSAGVRTGGVLVIKGIDMFGKNPGRDNHVCTITWIVKKSGKTSFDIRLISLIDDEDNVIGKPRGLSWKTKVVRSGGT
ncbi:MAG: TRAP transporter large permease subunit [Spirochaetales bacterium]|nr:TRAP transporter large permease subunit [Spirochaetales bacterium]